MDTDSRSRDDREKHETNVAKLRQQLDDRTKELARAEERWHSLVDTSPDLIMRLDPDGTIRYVNRVVTEFATVDLIGTSAYELVLPQYRHTMKECIDLVMRSGTCASCECRGKKAPGEDAWYSTRIGPYRDGSRIVGVTCVVTDITIRKRTVDQFALELEYNHYIVSNAPTIICGLSPDGITTAVNDAVTEITGYTPDEIIGKNWWHLFYPGEEYAQIEQLFADFEQGPVANYEMVLTASDGTRRTVSWNSVNRFDENGLLVEVIGIGADVTDRRRAEMSLRESEGRFRTIFEQAAVGMALLETNTGRFVRANQMYCRLLGYSYDELTQKTFQQITHPEDLQDDLDNMRRMIDGEIREFTMEKRYYRKDAQLVWVTLTVSAMWDPGGEPRYHIAIIQDISERKWAEAELRAEQHLLRRLIDLQEEERRMVAHDIHDGFVQDVVGAHMFVQSIQSTSEPSVIRSTADQVESLLQNAIAEGRRMIRDLRPIVLDDEGVIEAIQHLLADAETQTGLIVAFEHDVQFDRLEPRLEGLVYRIVQEALNNVKRHGQTDHAAVQLTQRNGLLELVVRDQGVGFDPDQVPLESFGLKGIRERARLLGGTARIESAIGDGTAVYAQLPIANGSPET